jgi:hypothetical protein
MDERRLFLDSTRPGGRGGWDIWVSTFSAEDNEFGEPQTLESYAPGSLVNDWTNEKHPSLTADEFTLFFSDAMSGSYRPEGMGGGDIWVSMRPSTEAPFEEPVNLNDISLIPVNTNAMEVFPFISRAWPAPGAELYFVSDRNGNRDIWRATWDPALEVFLRGDSNADSALDIADAICALTYLFIGDAIPTCLDATDANDDGAIDIADPIAVLSHLFAGSGPLPEPFGECGVDPTVDEVGCLAYQSCNDR